MKDFGRDSDVKVILWNPLTETLEAPEDFCKCCEFDKEILPGAARYRCL